MTENKPIVIEFRREPIELGRLNIITGDNGLGKTTLLDFLFGDVVKRGLPMDCSVYLKDNGVFSVFDKSIDEQGWRNMSISVTWEHLLKENGVAFAQKLCPDVSIPFPCVSQGIKRMVGLSYLVQKMRDNQHLALLIDDIELHLHPELQRLILPAILKMLHPNATLLVTTHSPLVLASLEPYFDEEQDKALHFELIGREIKLQEQPWLKHGDVVNWLTSDIFGLKQARSIEAEQAIDAANTFMRGESLADFPAHLQSKADIHKELCRVLPGHDHFWPRWVVTANVKSK